MTEKTTALTIPEEQPPENVGLSLFGSADPAEIILRASKCSAVLMDVVRSRGLIANIRNKEHLLLGAWQTLGAMCNVFGVIEWTRPVEGGWEARAVVQKNGVTIGAAEAMCLRAESRWKTADDFAIRSMAQTRALSKALRGPLGFIVEMAGFQGTPAEEMPDTPRTVIDPTAKEHGSGATFKRIAALLGPEGSPGDFYEAKALFEKYEWSAKTCGSFDRAMRKAADRLGLPKEPDFEDAAVDAAFAADMKAAGDEAARAVGK